MLPFFRIEEEVEKSTPVKHSKSPEETFVQNEKKKEKTEKKEDNKEEEDKQPDVSIFFSYYFPIHIIK